LIHWLGIGFCCEVSIGFRYSSRDCGRFGRLGKLRYAKQKLSSGRTQAAHDYHNVFKKRSKEISELSHVDVSKTRVLVLGCGYNYPDVVLWSNASELAVGVDVRRVFLRNGFRALNREYRGQGNGFSKSLVKAIVNRWSYRSYYDSMRKISGLDLDEIHQDLVAYNGIRLPFSDETFDIVCSNAVLEHVSELNAVSEEIRRVTRPSGVSFHLWHNYYALSGAHVPEEIFIASPWGHLLGDPEVDRWLRYTGTYLNKKLPNEISAVLSRDFNELRLNQVDRNHNRNGLDADFQYEGANLLTSDLEKKLSQYPKETLLTRAYSFIGMRK